MGCMLYNFSIIFSLYIVSESSNAMSLEYLKYLPLCVFQFVSNMYKYYKYVYVGSWMLVY